MPRIGICCPVDNATVDDDSCLACRTGPPRAGVHCNYSYEMLKGMMDSSGRATAHLSATMLTSLCPRRTQLEQQESFHMSPSRLFPAWRGTMGHRMTEAHPEPDCIYEQRFEAHLMIDDRKIRITGQVDKINPGQRLIQDFKTKTDSKLTRLKTPEESHIQQLNIYRWLVWHGWPQKKLKHGEVLYKVGWPAHIEIDRLELLYWSMNGTKPLPCPTWSFEETEAFIREKVAVLTGELAEVPATLNPTSSRMCLDWCPVRMHCLSAVF